MQTIGAIKSILLTRVLYLVWGMTVCKFGQHIGTTCLDGSASNFCAACYTQINHNLYHRYRVSTNDLALNEVVVAINPHHAQSFFAYKFHRANLIVEHIETLPGMTVDLWRQEMKRFIAAVPPVVVGHAITIRM